MKKIFALLLLCSLFFSCSFLGNDKGFATISFTFNDEVFDSLSKTSASRTARAASDDYTVKVKLTADDQVFNQETSFSKGEEATVTFDKIPVGARAKVSVKIYSGDTEIASGESEEVIIHAGQNVINITMKGGASYPIIIYSNRYDEVYKLEISENPSALNGMFKDSTDSDKKFYPTGAQIYDVAVIPKGASINSTDPDFSSDFAFGDNAIYFNNSGIISEVEKKSNGSYETINQLDLNEIFEQLVKDDLGSEAYNTDYSSLTGFDFDNGYIFFYLSYNYMWSNQHYYFGAVKIDGSGLVYQDLLSTFGDIDGFKVGTLSDGTKLLSVNQNDTIYILDFTMDEEGINMGGDEVRLRVPSVKKVSSSITPEITDMQFLDDYLYVTVCYYTSTSNGGPSNSDIVNDKVNFYSNGGVLKFNLKNRFDFDDFESWNNGEKILGWYKVDFLLNGKPQGDTTFVPPINQANKYFYGARKFIAKKPDELVIADDGIYLDIDLDNDKIVTKVNKIQNMNRVVTVNLANQSISAVDVDVSFDAGLLVGTVYGLQAF